MALRWYLYGDPSNAMERHQNEEMMKDPKVRQWAKRLAQIHERPRRHAFLMMVPEQYRDAVEQLARTRAC
jgi:hypothetical protein